mgnify:CR=1 FL=1
MAVQQAATADPPARLQTRAQLVEYLEGGCKPASSWRIGTEHEKFAYSLKDHKPLAYDSRPGIRQLLEGMQRFGWKPIMEQIPATAPLTKQIGPYYSGIATYSLVAVAMVVGSLLKPAPASSP